MRPVALIPGDLVGLRMLADHIQGLDRLEAAELQQELQELQESGMINDAAPPEQMRLIQLAVLHNDEESIRMLQKYGANLAFGLETAMTDPWLSLSERNELVRFLLSLGADPKVEEQLEAKATRTMKYFLHRARSCVAFQKLRQNLPRLEKIGAPSPQGGNVPELPRLPEIFFALIGQSVAVDIVVKKVIGWAA